MEIQKEFGRRVRELRKQAGLTQAQLAKRCGRSLEMQRIAEIERGERNCTLQTVGRLAKGLGCEPAELFLLTTRKRWGVPCRSSMLDLSISGRRPTTTASRR